MNQDVLRSSAEEPSDNAEGQCGLSRRHFLAKMSGTAGGILALQAVAEAQVDGYVPATDAVAAPGAYDLHPVTTLLKINGKEHRLTMDARVTLLDALRERLGLTGSKKGCDQGQCGACTVLVDGRRVLSCLTLAATVEGRAVTTIEGLANELELHPIQTAFIEHDGFQCGYCTPGQICSAVALLEEMKRGDVSHVTPDVRKPVPQMTDDEVRERMSGNICRCGAYPQILGAIQDVYAGRRRQSAGESAPQQGGHHETV